MIECLYCGFTRADGEFAAAEADDFHDVLPCDCGKDGLEKLAASLVYWPETGLFTVA